MSLKRIQKEYQKIKKHPLEGLSANPISEDDMFKWEGTIDGPVDTPYEGGKFKLRITFPQDYPMNPPNIIFTTKIFHPNISETYVCLDILQNKWSPVLSIEKVLLSLSSLLMDPNPNSPLVADANNLYVKDREKFNAKVKEWVKKYAS